MATQQLEVLILAKNQTDAAFKQVTNNLKTTEAQVVSSTDKMGKFAQGVGQVSTTLARSATAFGLPIAPLRALDDVADVAALGLKGLTTSAVGLNAASLGVAGAGLAVGGAIGSWLNTFPAVTNAVDKLTFALYGTAKAAQVSAFEQKKLNDAVTQQKDEALKKQVDLMLAQGKTAEQVKKYLADETKGYETSKEMLDRLIETDQKREEAKRKAAAEAKKDEAERIAAAEKYQKLLEALGEDEIAREKLLTSIRIELINDLAKRQQEAFDDNAELIKREMELRRESAEQEAENIQKIVEANDKRVDRENAQLEELRQSWIALAATVLDAMASLGMSADDAFVQIVAGFMRGMQAADAYLRAVNKVQKAQALLGAAQSAYSGGSVLGGAASGALMGFAVGGPIGAGIGAIAGGLLGLAGNAKKAKEEAEALRKQLEQMYQDFIRAMGGMDALRAKADTAGVSLEKLFDAKNADEMQRAIDGITRQLGLWEEATDKTNAAMERYGITIDQMGEKFAQQELDKQAMQLYEDYMLLTGAGADVALVNERMAEAINRYVQTSIKAGTVIPENMRPILEALLEQGLLTDEAGNKLETLDGITFGESTSAMEDLVLAVQDLVDALRQAFELSGNLNQSIGNTPSPGGGNPKYNPPEGGGFAEGGWFPYQAGGHRVTVGEAGNEAVLNEPQIQQLVAQAVAMAMAANGGSYQGGGPTVVQLNMDSREVGRAVITKGTRRRQSKVSAGGIRGRA